MKRLTIFTAALIFSYLLGCFYSLHFDISLWTEETRVTVLFFGVTFSFILVAFNVLDKLTE
jgi:hypothetical protein